MKKFLLLLALATTCTNPGTKQSPSYFTRDKETYSVEYPSQWRILEKPDALSDVYIGDASGDIGFTVLYFDTVLSLDVINREAVAGMKKAGIKPVSNEKIEINGTPFYKTVYEFPLGAISCKQISYTAKKGNKAFNIKFGNNKTVMEQNGELIEKIINSFIIK